MNDYLYLPRRSTPDPTVVRLERALAAVRYRPARRLGWLRWAVAIPSLAAAALVAAAVLSSREPAAPAKAKTEDLPQVAVEEPVAPAGPHDLEPPRSLTATPVTATRPEAEALATSH